MKDLAAAAEKAELTDLSRLLDGDEKSRALIEGVFGASPYLSSLIERNPRALQDWLTGDPDTSLKMLDKTLTQEIAAADSKTAAMRSLRQYKQRAALWLALADLGGVWSMEEVTRRLSDAAGHAVAMAVRFLFARAAQAGTFIPDDPGKPEVSSGYVVLGLGKLGAWELNYSSDIDLIIFYDLERARLAEGTEAAPFFIRLTRDFVALMQERTADGYVFRTDLRLRPDPGATQIALSTDAGLSYYESFGQNWERAALIKARAIAGDETAAKDFLKQLSPFIWRKYLDYAAIADIHAMKRRVHRFKGHGAIAIAGHDIKLGRGGIREIEFFAQTQQLIAGGRQNDLRTRGTLETLKKLAKRDWIDEDCVRELSVAYRFLRNVEHRLQMIADEQTHTLPENESDLERVAKFSGFEDTAAFGKTLVGYLRCVQQYYDALFDRLPQPEGGGDKETFSAQEDDPQAIQALEEMGFTDPKGVVAAVTVWRSGRYAATRSERARERLNEFLPDLISALAATADPDAALSAFDRFLSDLPAGVQLFSLLGANPELLRLIAAIMGTAPRLANVLSRKSRVLDAVLDPGFFGDLPPPDALSDLIEAEVGTAIDYQDMLDRARIIGREQAFLVGVRVLSGTISAERAGGAYARLAENLIRVLHAGVMRELERSHGVMQGGEAAVVAMGKLGGREMTATSDLDLIVIYDFDGSASMSNGTKPLAGTQYYARFTQRLISALTAPTAEGTLYEVDMRLRPSGNSGPVATHIDGFVDYQMNKAWTWEHLALTRARVVAGPAPLRARIEEVIGEILRAPRERREVADDVLEMRARIEKEKGTEDIWNLKQVRGGLVDLEFIAQFLQIIHASEHPGILDQNSFASLEKLSDSGLITANDAGVLIPAARLYHDLTQMQRLCLDKPFDPATASPGLKELLAKAGGQPDFGTLESHLSATLGSVRDAFKRLIF